MTGEFENEPLDYFLRQWAEAKRANQQRLDHLLQNIVSNLDELDATEPAVSDRSSFWRSVSLAAMGASLMLLIALSWSLSTRQNNGGEIVASAPTFVLPKISQTELEQKRILISEFARVFDRHLTWIVETDGKVQLGVEQLVDQQSGSPNTAPIVVRVAVMRLKDGQTNWEHVWSADIVSRSEQLVELSPESDSDTRLLIWAYALPDGMIAVDGEMHLTGMETFRPTFNELHRPGDSHKVFTTKLGDTEYQVFQAVEILDDNVSSLNVTS